MTILREARRMRGRIFRYLALFAFLVLAILLFAYRAKASESPPPVFFNELMWRGSSVSTADEWIELYNNSDEVVDISGWEIFDVSKNRTMINIERGKVAPRGYFLISNNDKEHLFSGGESVLGIQPDIVESGVSISNDKLLLVLKDEGTVVDVVGDGLSGFYNNTICSADDLLLYGDPACGDRLEFRSITRINDYADGAVPINWRGESGKKNLRSCAENEEDCPFNFTTPENSGKPYIESVDLSPSIYFPRQLNKIRVEYKIEDPKDDLEKVYLMEIGPDGGDSQVSVPVSGGAVEVAYDYCPKFIFVAEDATGLTDEYDLDLRCAYLNKSLVINEVMPHPVSKDWDGNGRLGVGDEWIEIYNDSSIDTDLSGWTIQDKSGKKFHLDDFVIKAGSYLVLYKGITKISLNDDSEEIYLIDPVGAKVDTVDIPKSTKYPDFAFARFGKKWNWSRSATPQKENVLVAVERDTGGDGDIDQDKKMSAPVTIAVAQTSEPKSDEVQPEMISRVITTTTTIATIRRSVPTVLSSSQIAPIVLGSMIRRQTPRAFIRSEYLLYLLGFVAFLLLTFCYEICRRE